MSSSWREPGPCLARGFHVALGDGSVRWITPEISEKTLREAIIRNDEKAFIDW